MRPDDLLECALPEGARPEPVLAPAVLSGAFVEPEPPDPQRLDPERAKTEPVAMPPWHRAQRLTVGLAGSLGIHLLPLLLLVHLNGAPPDTAAPIPVQLVFETPPAVAAPEKRPPPGRLASEDMGETAAKPDHSGASAEPAADRPDETAIAAVAPPPDPIRPPKLVSALPKPDPPAEPAALPEEPTPTPHVTPRLKHAAVARLAPKPRPAGRAQIPGPAATRDEYLAYCLSLVRRHFGRLPPSFLAGRRGTTVLRIEVLGDGTIARIAVARRSPYPDIDARIEAAVAAVSRFPPVPQWFQGSSVSLTLHVGYPEGL